MKTTYRFVNFLASYEAFKRLQRQPEDVFAYNDLVAIEGPLQAEWLHESVTGKQIVRSHPILWHPGQALWARNNIPDLEELIMKDARDIGLRLDGFVPTEFEVEQWMIDSILYGKSSGSTTTSAASIDDILAKYNRS